MLTWSMLLRITLRIEVTCEVVRIRRVKPMSLTRFSTCPGDEKNVMRVFDEGRSQNGLVTFSCSIFEDWNRSSTQRVASKPC